MKEFSFNDYFQIKFSSINPRAKSKSPTLSVAVPVADVLVVKAIVVPIEAAPAPGKQEVHPNDH